MSLLYVIKIILIGSGALISMSAINDLYFYPVTWLLLIKLFCGVAISIILLPRCYWLMAIILIFSLSGLAGMSLLISDYAGLYLLGIDLRHSENQYIFQGIFSLFFLLVLIVWYFRNRNMIKNGDIYKRHSDPKK